jgi:hypothetical protein
MSALAVLNQAVTALGDAYPVWLADFLTIDEEGLLKLPDEPAQYTLTLITDAPTHEWDHLKYRTVRVQLNAWSRTEGEALSMLATAETALLNAGFIPLDSRALPRDGLYIGAAQDFERTA